VDKSVRCPNCRSECWSDEGYETIYRCKNMRCGLVFTVEKKGD
jgi:uncharacterized protein with PIN domain